MAYWRGWRYGALWVGALGTLGLVMYPIAIAPMLDPRPYQEMQKRARMNIRQEDVQPGNMKVWSDPFDRKK